MSTREDIEHFKRRVELISDSIKSDSDLVVGLTELVDLQQAYIKLILEETAELVPIAHDHGWKSTRHEEGKRIRIKLEVLEELFGIIS